jgi:hypothetical protein
MMYKQQGGDIAQNNTSIGYGNCQQFIDEVMSTLGIDTSKSFPEPLKKYIQKLRSNGYGKMEFIMDDNFHKRFFISSSGRGRSSSVTSNGGTPSTGSNHLAMTPNTPVSSDLQTDDHAKNEDLSDDESTNATTATHMHTDDRVDSFDPSKYRKKKKIVFKTHAKLDQFMHFLVTQEPEFQFLYKYEYYLLKSFDRAFWMRALSSNFENKTFTPCVDEYQVHCCPFGDPRDTSIIALSLKKM